MIYLLVSEVTVTAAMMLGYNFSGPFTHLFGKRFTSDRFEQLNRVLSHNALKKLSLHKVKFKWQRQSNSK